MLAQAESKGSWPQKQRRRKYRLILIIILGALVVCLTLFLITKRVQTIEIPEASPHSYSYLETVSKGQVKLHMMSLSPENVALRSIVSPLHQVESYGINGGFFYGTDLLSIAIMNDIPVSGKKNGYGSGWFNAKYPRGTMVWDSAIRKFSVQVVSSGDELAVSDRNQYFAQGGISMNLADEDLWEATAIKEHLPFADEQRMRSGMVYADNEKLWLIVTPTLCTAAEFRTAVLEAVPGQGREGIFLDGDGSSQMNASEVMLSGDGRMVVQMIAVDGD